MLRNYKDYRNIRPLRRNSYGNINLVSNSHGKYFILSTQIVPKDKPGWLEQKQILYKGLNHPNVDQALDVFVSQSNTLKELVVVTQMCQNTSLDALLGSLSPFETRLALLDIADGLCYLHEARVLHRNLRCQSILVRGGRYLISDYSEAELLAEGARVHGLAGKKQSMSPEMLAADPYHFPSDVWSFGILFVQLLSGLPIRSVESKLVALVPDFPEGIIPRITDGWAKQLLRQIFKKDPQKRISMAQVKKQLRQSLKDPWMHDPWAEVKSLSETSRLLVDRDRHLFVQKSFATSFPETAAIQEAKLLTTADHPNIVRVQTIHIRQGQCEATLEYCRSGPLLSTFKQLYRNEVLDTIEGVWQGFCYLQERGLLLAQHLSLQHILISEARPKLQLFTEKTFGMRGEQHAYYGLPELAILFLELILREQVNKGQVCATIRNKKGLELEETELESIIVGMIHPESTVLWSVSQVHHRLTAFLKNKRAEETIMVYKQYRVIRQIARGVLGTVCLAENQKQQQFALKIIPCRLPTDQADAKNEAENLIKARHPHVVELYEYFSNDSQTEMILVMECCEEQTLKDILDILTPSQKTQVMQQLCQVVRFLHIERQMIHRDIKPVNILVKDGHIKLADFGRSKILAQGERLTVAVGCEEYMPPQMANSEGYSFSADVWNLGIVLLDICLGQLLYPNSIAYMDPAFPEKLIADVPDAFLRRLLTGMIQRKVSQRLTIEEVCSMTRTLI